MRPIQCSVGFSSTENIAKPFSVHAPTIVAKPRQAAARGCTPPMYLATSGSAENLAQASKSSAAGGRSSSLGVSITGSDGAFIERVPAVAARS